MQMEDIATGWEMATVGILALLQQHRQRGTSIPLAVGSRALVEVRRTPPACHRIRRFQVAIPVAMVAIESKVEEGTDSSTFFIAARRLFTLEHGLEVHQDGDVWYVYRKPSGRGRTQSRRCCSGIGSRQ